MSLIPEIREFDEEKRQLLGPVLIPNRFDQHGDAITINEINFSCHYYNKNHMGQTDIDHDWVSASCEIIESYILPVDWTVGEITLPKGTWMAVLKIEKDALGDIVWQMLRDGTLQGFSPMGKLLENKII